MPSTASSKSASKNSLEMHDGKCANQRLPIDVLMEFVVEDIHRIKSQIIYLVEDIGYIKSRVQNSEFEWPLKIIDNMAQAFQDLYAAVHGSRDRCVLEEDDQWRDEHACAKHCAKQARRSHSRT